MRHYAKKEIAKSIKKLKKGILCHEKEIRFHQHEVYKNKAAIIELNQILAEQDVPVLGQPIQNNSTQQP